MSRKCGSSFTIRYPLARGGEDSRIGDSFDLTVFQAPCKRLRYPQSAKTTVLRARISSMQTLIVSGSTISLTKYRTVMAKVGQPELTRHAKVAVFRLASSPRTPSPPPSGAILMRPRRQSEHRATGCEVTNRSRAVSPSPCVSRERVTEHYA
jgi:hypothetical protein